MPYITAMEKNTLGHKPKKHRLSLALCANASGDCKIKPLLIYHSVTPTAFKSRTIFELKPEVYVESNSGDLEYHTGLCRRGNYVFNPDVKKHPWK